MNETIQERKTGELRGENTKKQDNQNSDDGKFGVDSKSKQFFENRIEREWLSTEEAAHFLSVSSNALRIMVYRSQIPAYKFGRRLRFRVRDCRALFERKGA